MNKQQRILLFILVCLLSLFAKSFVKSKASPLPIEKKYADSRPDHYSKEDTSKSAKADEGESLSLEEMYYRRSAQEGIAPQGQYRALEEAPSGESHMEELYAEKEYKAPHYRRGKTKKWRKRKGWHFKFPRLFGNFLDLDWLLIALAILIPALLIALLYFLLGGVVLSFFEMFIFALGFGFALFAYIFLLSEYPFDQANYDFFVRFGFATWLGIFAIIAGIAGLFGSSASFGTFILIGLAVGLLSFLVSLILKKSIFEYLNEHD